MQKQSTHLFIVVHVIVQLLIAHLSHGYSAHTLTSSRVAQLDSRLSFIRSGKMDPSLSRLGSIPSRPYGWEDTPYPLDRHSPTWQVHRVLIGCVILYKKENESLDCNCEFS